MKKTILFLIGAAVILSTGTPLQAASNAGASGAAFLKIGLGARPAGMGGAFAAVADDLNAVQYNPAGLAQLTKTEVAATYLKYFQDINYGLVGGATPVSGLGVLGLSAAYLSLSGIETRDASENLLDDNAGASDMVIAASWAAAGPMEGLDIGANLKVLSEKIVSDRATTFAADLGGLYQGPLENLSLGLVIQNIGPGLKFVDVRDPLPLNLKAGAAYRLFDQKLLIAADMDYYIVDRKCYGQFGAEYTFLEMISPRVGYRVGGDLGSLAGLSAGIGFRLPVGGLDLGLDYAFAPSFGDLGDNGHRITVLARF
jgi:hypothetical protein